ncbi:MAG: SDR family oxidoreductase [Deltaproteobacteria bacterium]|nr:SDR family oxidoreductase [Deltaproteobacteria bacterium]
MAEKIAIVNGGAGGIGRAVVRRLGQAGYDIFILDKNQQAGQETIEQLRQQGCHAEFRAVELTDAAAIKNVFAAIYREAGRVDLLVNLAGGTLHKHDIQDFPLAEWREVIDVNLKATFLCCQQVCKPMRERRGGVIINTSSNFGITGGAGRTAYAAAKAAVIAFTKSLATEVAPHGVRVNAIAPGLTATARVMGGYNNADWRRLGRTIPMGRAAEPSEIAEGVAFLASDDAGYVTGQTLHVNGGMIFN